VGKHFRKAVIKEGGAVGTQRRELALGTSIAVAFKGSEIVGVGVGVSSESSANMLHPFPLRAASSFRETLELGSQGALFGVNFGLSCKLTME